MSRPVNLRLIFLILLPALILIYLAATSFSPVVSPPPEYRYIDSGHSLYPFVKFLANRQIIDNPENTFVPDLSISRAEAAGMLVRALGPLSPEDSFMEAAAAAGIIDSQNLRPDDDLTRAETADWMLRFAGEELPPGTGLPEQVGDVAETHWARGEIAAVLDAGIMVPADPSRFDPDEPVTRADFARALAVTLVLSPRYLQVPLGGELIPLEGDVFLTAAGQGPRNVTAPSPVGIGETVRTGSKGRAEIRFTDGSGILLMPDTTITVRRLDGQATILKNGDAGAIVDLLEIELPRGKIFGALAAGYIFDHYAPDPPAHEDAVPWWKKPFVKKERARVNMPWGVAGVRGTFWMNEVTEEANITNVLHGEVQVTSAGGFALVLSGESTVISYSGAAPGDPVPLTDGERQAWLEVEDWVRARCLAMEENAPYATPRYLASGEAIPPRVTGTVEPSLKAFHPGPGTGVSASAEVSFTVIPSGEGRFSYTEHAQDDDGQDRVTHIELPY